MANKDIRAIYDNGTMIWPATTTTAVVDPTSREALDVILGKKEDKPVEITECIPSRLMSINSAEDAVTLSSAEEAQLAPIIAGQNATTKFTYYSAQAIPLDISGAYAWEILGLRGFTGEVFWILKLRYIDEEVSGETVRSYWVEQEMKTPVFAEIDPTNQPTFIDVDMADLVTDSVTYPGEVWYLLSEEDDPYPESTFIDSEGRNKRIVLRIRPLEDDDYDWGIEFENPESWYFPIAIELSPLEGDYYPQSGVLHAAETAEILRGIQLYNGILYCALIYTFEEDNNHNYYIAIHKTEMKGKISGMPAYEDTPTYPTEGDTYTTGFGKLNRIIQSHEEVTARALLDLDSRIQNLPGGGGGGIQEITWSALKTLKDGENLTPGQLYRITDYTCTTTQADTQSAGHLFDIIVLALSGSVLSEEAWAIQHSGDTYFANSNLAAWELKYCLDNDTTRFKWADTTNGKGVIYWMKDEWKNECPYDFKNIQFKRKVIQVNYEIYKLDTVSGTDTWLYTFAANEHDLQNDTWSNLLDGSLESPFLHMSDENNSTYYNNIINPYISIYNDNENVTLAGLQYLNNIVFIGYYEINGDTSNGDYQYPHCASDNIFKSNCYNNTLEVDCHCNTFESDCHDNILGRYCYNNKLGKDCTNNIFRDGCSNNTLGLDSHGNVFGNSCNNNVFGSNCSNNTFGNSCSNNTFGNYCSTNTFLKNGNSSYNVIGDNCDHLSLLGNNALTTIKFCTLGQGCKYIIFPPISVIQCGTIESGNSYLSLINTSGQGNGALQNFRICSGISGTSSNYKNVYFNVSDNSYLITFKPANSVEISV